MKKKIGIALGALGIGALLASFARPKSENPIPPVKGPIHPNGRFNTIRSGAIHGGIDIMIPTGTPVVSPLSGEVKQVYYNSRGGNQVIIRHDNGLITGYAHLSSVLVKVGQKVHRGQIIAKSGNTGMSTGPHLHFTLRLSNGQAVDPERYLRFN